MEQFQRTIRLIGDNDFKKLQQAKVVVYGVGGVGGHAIDALCRAGIGNFIIIDKDTVDVTNINRQLIANLNTIGKDKVDVIKEHILSINAQANVCVHKVFITKDNANEYIYEDATYVLDCIDNITAKLTLIDKCSKLSIPILSCMGAGNRLTGNFEVVDVFKTYNDPVSRIMRQKLKEMGISSCQVVWTKSEAEKLKDGIQTPASISFMPPMAGLTMAQYVVNKIIEKD